MYSCYYVKYTTIEGKLSHTLPCKYGPKGQMNTAVTTATKAFVAEMAVIKVNVRTRLSNYL